MIAVHEASNEWVVFFIKNLGFLPSFTFKINLKCNSSVRGQYHHRNSSMFSISWGTWGNKNGGYEWPPCPWYFLGVEKHITTTADKQCFFFLLKQHNLSFKLPGRGSKRHMHQWKSKGKGIMQTSLCCFQIQLVDLMPHVFTEW